MTDDFQKPRYEIPIMFDLGGMAKGSGVCEGGSAPSINPIDCTAGVTASNACTAGTAAQTACTAGSTNIGATCSRGGFANPTCTGGTQPATGTPN
jgi:hypothetical protein